MLSQGSEPAFLGVDTVLYTYSLNDPQYGILAGIICLVITFIGNGIHSSCAKFAGPTASPFVYVFYLVWGLFTSCTIIVSAMGKPLEVSGPGLLGGLLLSVSCTLGINALMLIGIVWSDMTVASAATLTSFLWGKLYFREPSANLGMTAVGLVLLLLGIACLSMLLAARQQSVRAEEEDEGGRHAAWYLPAGLICAILCGTAGGTSFPINKLQPSDRQGVSFVWAQALGMVIAQTIILAVALGRDAWAQAAPEKVQALVWGRWEAQRLMPLALLQGAILAGTNLTTTVAALSPLGVAVAQPVREAGHCLAVLIGALGFREYGRPDSCFMSMLLACTGIEIAGMVLLITYGSAPQ